MAAVGSAFALTPAQRQRLICFAVIFSDTRRKGDIFRELES